jgi:hypothetical protein
VEVRGKCEVQRRSLPLLDSLPSPKTWLGGARAYLILHLQLVDQHEGNLIPFQYLRAMRLQLGPQSRLGWLEVQLVQTVRGTGLHLRCDVLAPVAAHLPGALEALWGQLPPDGLGHRSDSTCCVSDSSQGAVPASRPVLSRAL